MKPRRSTPAWASALLLSASCALARTRSEDPAPVVRGPIPARTQQPVKLTFLSFRPRRAATEAEGATAVSVLSAYSSIFQDGTSAQDRVLFDAELWRNSLALRRGLGPRTDVEVELSALYASSGFLDRFVESWHRLLGLPDGGREDRPAGQYEVIAQHGTQTVYELEPYQVGFEDVPVVLTQRIVDETPSTPGVSVRAGVELPTGSERKGFGNGKLDAGLGVLAERSWGRWTATAAVDWVDVASSRSFERAGIEAQDGLDAQLGLEYRWSDGLSLLGGLVDEPAVTRDMDILEIDSPILSLDLGAAFDLGRGSRLLLDFGEDLIAESGPDFTVFAAWSWSL